MSGYLKRMAASVARPAGAVHPLVTGLPAKGARAEAGAETGEVEMLVERPRARELDRAEGARERGPLEADASNGDAAASSHEPLVSGWKQEAATERRGATREVGLDGNRARRERVEDVREVAGSGERGEVEARMLVPIVKRVEAGVEEEAATPREVEYPRAAARVGEVAVRREAADQRSAKKDEAERGGEEIQIHIGRIEVIAVPPSAQRPAPARVQHGETLEAYLKRHDRRSR